MSNSILYYHGTCFTESSSKIIMFEGFRSPCVKVVGKFASYNFLKFIAFSHSYDLNINNRSIHSDFLPENLTKTCELS
jgi:hypothetical protein